MHRDLKPENLLLVDGSPDSIVKVGCELARVTVFFFWLFAASPLRVRKIVERASPVNRAGHRLGPQFVALFATHTCPVLVVCGVH